MSHFAKCTKENDLIWSIVPQLNTNEFLHNTLPLCSLGGLIFSSLRFAVIWNCQKPLYALA